MALAAEKVDIRELIGVAINAENLGEDMTHATLRDVDRLAAFGMVTARSLRARLASALWRIRWGHDQRARKEAGHLFAAMLVKRDEVERRWNIRDAGSHMLQAFSLAVVLEWEHEQCPACGGVGSVPASMAFSRASKRVHCRRCEGRGSCKPSIGDRARVLGISIAAYEKHWPRRFEQAHHWLGECEASITTPLQRKLRRV